MNSIKIPFLIRRDKKNALRPSGKGKKFHYDTAVSDIPKKLPMFLKRLFSWDKEHGVKLIIEVDLKKEEMLIRVDPVWPPYDLPRHADLPAVIQTIADALEKSGRIFNDSRIVSIEAKIV